MLSCVITGCLCTGISETIGEEKMQGSDYDDDLVRVHEAGWQNWTKFVLWAVISVAAFLLILAITLID